MIATIDSMTFDRKVLAACEDREWTASDLARRVGVSKNTTGRWLSGQTRPYEESLVRLARVLDLSLDYLADDALDEPPAPALSEDERTVLEVYRALRLDAQAAIRGLTAAARQEAVESLDEDYHVAEDESPPSRRRHTGGRGA